MSNWAYFRPMVTLRRLGVTCLALLLTWGGMGITQHFIAMMDRVGDAAAATTATNVQVQSTLKRLNMPGGTLFMLDEDLGVAKSLLIHGDMVFKHEQTQLTTWDAMGQTLFTDLSAAISSVPGVMTQLTTDLGTLDTTMKAAQPVLANAATAEGSMNTAIKLFNDRLSDPRVDQLMTHLESTATHVDGMSASGDQIGKDTAAKIHSILHPDIKKLTFAGGIDAAVFWFHSHLEPPLL